jgi:hypothetical protein
MGRNRREGLKSVPRAGVRQIAAPRFAPRSASCPGVFPIRVLLGLALIPSSAFHLAAATLVSGGAVIDYDAAAWSGLAAATGYPQPVLTLDAFFNQAEAAVATHDELLQAAKPGASYRGQTYTLNAASVTNLAQRSAQPTTFAWEPGNLAGHTGAVGLGGVTRFTVSGGGVLLFGDFTLLYSSARIARGGSGWFLKGNITPAAPAFDLLDPVVVETANGFTISADLGVSFEVANFLFATPADALRVVGRFRFTGSSVAVPAEPPAVERAEFVAEGMRLAGKGGAPNGNFMVQAASRLDAAGGEWTDVAAGQFDAEGRFGLAVPAPSGPTERWFRLVIP